MRKVSSWLALLFASLVILATFVAAIVERSTTDVRDGGETLQTESTVLGLPLDDNHNDLWNVDHSHHKEDPHRHYGHRRSRKHHGNHPHVHHGKRPCKHRPKPHCPMNPTSPSCVPPAKIIALLEQWKKDLSGLRQDEFNALVVLNITIYSLAHQQGELTNALSNLNAALAELKQARVDGCSSAAIDKVIAAVEKAQADATHAQADGVKAQQAINAAKAELESILADIRDLEAAMAALQAYLVAHVSTGDGGSGLDALLWRF
jgi:hypothetical protein